MRIGITGATGFIGREVGKLAAGSGHEFIAYTRRHGEYASLSTETLYQPKAAPHALPETQLDALVHLSGESLMGWWSEEKRRRIWKSRVDMTRALVSHLATWKPENRPKVLLCASGIGYYGNRSEDTLTETESAGSGFLADICVAWEKAAQEAEALGMRVVHLRTGFVLGRHGGALPVMTRLFRFGLGGRLGSGRQWMPWIHIQDQASLILWAAENESVRGPLNLCSPNPVTNAELTRQLARVLHRPAFFWAPSWVLRTLLRDTAKEMLLTSQKALPQVAQSQGYRFAYTDLHEALKSLM